MEKTIHSKHAAIIAERLVNIRKKAKLTQRELAKKLEREHSFVAHYELGERRVDLAEFYWICSACGATPHKEASDLMKAFAAL
jgi:transcriptional regulator with XRE-family HTH domain